VNHDARKEVRVYLFLRLRFGEWLLVDALKKLLMASDTIAFPIVIVDAKGGAENFYEKYGFTALKDTDNTLFITMADIRASISELV